MGIVKKIKNMLGMGSKDKEEEEKDLEDKLTE